MNGFQPPVCADWPSMGGNPVLLSYWLERLDSTSKGNGNFGGQEKIDFSTCTVLWHRESMIEACHSGIATKETFCAAFDCIFREATSHSYAILTFNAFDRCSRGYVTFSDFAQTLSCLLHGTREEILNWIFDLYDVNKDGYISRQELVILIRAVNDLLGPAHNAKELMESVDEKANWMLNKFDVDRDGKIERSKFISICLQPSEAPFNAW
ncbi:hypothetical protein Aperf_G00000069647 [Anoplocephala perfoliata]